MRVKDLNADTAVMYQCALGRSEWLPNQKYGYQRASDVIGSSSVVDNQDISVPIYFHDADYRKKRHEYLQYIIYWDETEGPGSRLTQEWDHSSTQRYHRIKSALHGKHSLQMAKPVQL
jgi:hypothetical protein